MSRPWLGAAGNPDAQEEFEEQARDTPVFSRFRPVVDEPWDVADLAAMQWGEEARGW